MFRQLLERWRTRGRSDAYKWNQRYIGEWHRASYRSDSGGGNATARAGGYAVRYAEDASVTSSDQLANDDTPSGGTVANDADVIAGEEPIYEFVKTERPSDETPGFAKLDETSGSAKSAATSGSARRDETPASTELRTTESDELRTTESDELRTTESDESEWFTYTPTQRMADFDIADIVNEAMDNIHHVTSRRDSGEAENTGTLNASCSDNETASEVASDDDMSNGDSDDDARHGSASDNRCDDGRWRPNDDSYNEDYVSNETHAADSVMVNEELPSCDVYSLTRARDAAITHPVTRTRDAAIMHPVTRTRDAAIMHSVTRTRDASAVDAMSMSAEMVAENRPPVRIGKKRVTFEDDVVSVACDDDLYSLAGDQKRKLRWRPTVRYVALLTAWVTLVRI